MQQQQQQMKKNRLATSLYGDKSSIWKIVSPHGLGEKLGKNQILVEKAAHDYWRTLVRFLGFRIDDLL